MLSESYVRNSDFCDVSNELLTDHDDYQLHAQLQEATLCRASFKSESSCPAKSLVLARRAYKVLVLEESNVENRCVCVDKLEPEHLDGEAVFVISLCSRVLPVSKHHSNPLVHEFQNVDHQQVDACSGTYNVNQRFFCWQTKRFLGDWL